MKYYILDEDISTRRILEKIIRDESLGEVVGQSDSPVEAVREINDYQPTIVLIDLMPVQDGIETVQFLKERHATMKYVMISQIENKDMVGRAYVAGVEYFIHKPINRIEVASVIRKVIEKIKMEQSIDSIKRSLSLFSNEQESSYQKPNIEKITQEILTDLGILGESGSSDVADLVKFLIEKNVEIETVSLKDLYKQVSKSKDEKSVKAFEQRIRRAVNQALINLSSLGLTDFSHPKFELYATKFFDFSEIRLKMNELDEKKFSRNPRINMKKFLYAFYIEVQNRM